MATSRTLRLRLQRDGRWQVGRPLPAGSSLQMRDLLVVDVPPEVPDDAVVDQVMRLALAPSVQQLDWPALDALPPASIVLPALITPPQLSQYVAALEAQGHSQNSIAAHMGRDPDNLVDWMVGAVRIPKAVQKLIADRAIQSEDGELVTRTRPPKRGRPFGR